MKLKHVGLTFACLALLTFFTMPLVIGQNNPAIEIEIGKKLSPQQLLRDALTQHYEAHDYPAALTAYQKVIDRFPDSDEAAEAQFRIANLYHWDTKQPEEAVQAYQKVIDNYPDTPFAIEALIRQGEAFHWERKEYAQAIVRYEQVLAKYPQSEYAPWAQLLIAEAHAGAEDYGKAVEDYASVVTRYPGSEWAPEAQVKLGNTLFREVKDLEKARAAYEKAITEYPESPWLADAYYYLGRYYKMHGDRERAAEQFEAVIQKYPEHVTVSYLALKELDAAYRYIPDSLLEEFKFRGINISDPTPEYRVRRRQFIQQYPEYCRQRMLQGGWEELSARWSLAIFWENRGQNNSATEEFEGMVENYPEHAYGAASLYELAHIYLGQHQYEKSLEYSQTLLSKHPEDAWADNARFVMSRNYAEQGRLQDAIRIEDEIIQNSAFQHRVEAAQARKADYLERLRQGN